MFELRRTWDTRELLCCALQQQRPHGRQPHEVALRKLAIGLLLDTEPLLALHVQQVRVRGEKEVSVICSMPTVAWCQEEESDSIEAEEVLAGRTAEVCSHRVLIVHSGTGNRRRCFQICWRRGHQVRAIQRPTEALQPRRAAGGIPMQLLNHPASACGAAIAH